MKQITITFPRDHSKPSKIEVDGVQGESCTKLTEGIEKALGTVGNHEHKPEFYERPLEQHETVRESL